DALPILSLFTYSKVAFDGDLSKINFVPKEQQLAEKELYADHKVAKNLFVVAFDEDQEKALQLNSGIHKKLSAFSTVDNLQTISSLIPSQTLQNKAINRWKSFWTDEKLNNDIKSIEEESVKTGFVAQTHQPFYKLLKTNFSTIDLNTLKQFNKELYSEFVHGKNRYLLSTVVTLNPENREEFVSTFEKEFKGENVLVIDR